jgi:hypothetical protein
MNGVPPLFVGIGEKPRLRIRQRKQLLEELFNKPDTHEPKFPIQACELSEFDMGNEIPSLNP